MIQTHCWSVREFCSLSEKRVLTRLRNLFTSGPVEYSHYFCRYFINELYANILFIFWTMYFKNHGAYYCSSIKISVLRWCPIFRICVQVSWEERDLAVRVRPGYRQQHRQPLLHVQVCTLTPAEGTKVKLTKLLLK